MTKTKGAPRPDHIANLTIGAKLPLDPLDDAHLSLILEVVSQAWRELCNEGLTALYSGIETEVSALLGPRLNNLRDSNAMWSSLVSNVGLGSEAFNFNGKKLQTKPDLHFILTRRNANFPLIVECKIIDHPNSKSVDLYCTKGIARFICGDYAWANREAIMIAYVRDGSTIQQRLAPHLVKSAKQAPDPFQTKSHPCPRPDIHPTIHCTEHERSFRYLPEGDAKNPGTINLLHLWLDPVVLETKGLD